VKDDFLLEFDAVRHLIDRQLITESTTDLLLYTF